MGQLGFSPAIDVRPGYWCDMWGHRPFRHPNKTRGIKIWVLCDAKSSYAWNMQVHTDKPAGAPPEKNQGMRVVLDMTEGLQGKTVTCDNFFLHKLLVWSCWEGRCTCWEQVWASPCTGDKKKQGSVFIKVCLHWDTCSGVLSWQK